MAKMIPIAPIPIPVLVAISSPFMRFTANIGKIFPKLKFELIKSELGVNEKEYGAMMLFLILFYTIFFGALLTLLLSKMMPENGVLLGIGLGLFMGVMVFVQVIMYPTMIVRKKVNSIEKNLVFALRAILVQLKSGIALFDSMTMVARGDYGTISQEFQKAVDEINTGTPEQEALERMSENNPSPFLRKSLWQIVNGMNAGADISDILAETVKSMLREQKIAINKYGAQLKVLSLMYMMIGVIMPALGVTLLIILFTFPMVGDAVAKQPALNDIAVILQDVLPGETYTQGEYITGLGGKQDYSGEELKIEVEKIDGKSALVMLMTEDNEIIEGRTVYDVESNLRDEFSTEEGISLFGESLKVKSIGPNLFGQEQIEITRIESSQLVFWGLLGLVAVMEFMYIGIIKSRRPSIIG